MITAYASGAPNPTQAQSDVIVDLQGGDTLPTTAQLYGGGVDLNDPAASFSFSWTILRRPSGSGAALNDNATQNPTLGSIDQWNNYRLFLIVTNTATGVSSEIDPLLAPASAFVTVRVQSLELGIEKPATGERDWQSKAYAWVDAIEDHESRIDDLEAQGHNLNDLLDVTLGTLTTGQGIIYDGAGWVNSSVASNLNGLSDVTLGTLTTGQGLIYDGTEWVNSAPTLTIQDAYTTTAIDLVEDNLVFTSDAQSITITQGTLSGNPTLNFDVASTLTVDTLNVNNDLTINADNDAVNPTIYMPAGSVHAPAITYDRSTQEFQVMRTSVEGYKNVITEADLATSTDYGIVQIASGATSYNTGSHILDVERLMFTGAVDGMVNYKGATQQHKSIDPDVEIDLYDSNNYAQHAAIIFKNVTGKALGISDISIVMASSGVSTSTEYAFSLVVYTSLSNLSSNTASTTYALPAFTRIADNQAGGCDFNYITDNSGTPIGIAAGAYFGILVTSAPDYAGNRLQCSIQAFREIN